MIFYRHTIILTVITVTSFISVYGDVRALLVYFSALPFYKVCFSASNNMNSPFFILLIISSSEPLGSQSGLIVYPSSRRPSVRPSYVVRRRPPFQLTLAEGSQGELIIYQSSCRLCVCLCVNIFKLEYLRNQ